MDNEILFNFVKSIDKSTYPLQDLLFSIKYNTSHLSDLLGDIKSLLIIITVLLTFIFLKEYIQELRKYLSGHLISLNKKLFSD